MEIKSARTSGTGITTRRHVYVAAVDHVISCKKIPRTAGSNALFCSSSAWPHRVTRCLAMICPERVCRFNRSMQHRQISLWEFRIPTSHVAVRLADAPLCSVGRASTPASESTVSAGHWCSHWNRAATLRIAEENVGGLCLRGLRKTYVPSAFDCILKPVPGLKCFHWLTWRG